MLIGYVGRVYWYCILIKGSQTDRQTDRQTADRTLRHDCERDIFSSIGCSRLHVLGCFGQIAVYKKGMRGWGRGGGEREGEREGEIEGCFDHITIYMQEWGGGER